jgi:hypothetical protein
MDDISPALAMTIAERVRALVDSLQDTLRADNEAADRGHGITYDAFDLAEMLCEFGKEMAALLGIDVEPESADDADDAGA